MTIGIEPGTSQIKIQGPTETHGIMQGIGMKISVTELEEPTGMSETISKIDGMMPEMKPEGLTET